MIHPPSTSHIHLHLKLRPHQPPQRPHLGAKPIGQRADILPAIDEVISLLRPLRRCSLVSNLPLSVDGIEITPRVEREGKKGGANP